MADLTGGHLVAPTLTPAGVGHVLMGSPAHRRLGFVPLCEIGMSRRLVAPPAAR